MHDIFTGVNNGGIKDAKIGFKGCKILEKRGVISSDDLDNSGEDSGNSGNGFSFSSLTPGKKLKVCCIDDEDSVNDNSCTGLVVSLSKSLSTIVEGTKNNKKTSVVLTDDGDSQRKDSASI